MKRLLLVLAILTLAVPALGQDGIFIKKNLAASAPPEALVRTDNFNHTDNPLGDSQWTTAPGTAAAQSDGTKAKATSSGVNNASYWSADTFNADQCAETTFETYGTKGPAVRIQTGSASLDGYSLRSTSATQMYFRKCVSGTCSNFGSAMTTSTVGATDRIMLCASGTSTTTLGYYVNDTLVDEQDDSSSPHNGGQPGIMFFYTDSPLDDWEGKDK